MTLPCFTVVINEDLTMVKDGDGTWFPAGNETFWFDTDQELWARYPEAVVVGEPVAVPHRPDSARPRTDDDDWCTCGDIKDEHVDSHGRCEAQSGHCSCQHFVDSNPDSRDDGTD